MHVLNVNTIEWSLNWLGVLLPCLQSLKILPDDDMEQILAMDKKAKKKWEFDFIQVRFH